MQGLGPWGVGAARERLCPPAGQAGALMAPQAKAAEDKPGRPRATLMQCRPLYGTGPVDQRSVTTCEDDGPLENMQPKLFFFYIFMGV